nr:hypothetical protein [Xanthomonas vasicola]
MTNTGVASVGSSFICDSSYVGAWIKLLAMDKADSSAGSARIAPSSLRGVVGVSQLGAAQGGRVAWRGDEVAQVAEPATGLAAKHSVDALHLLVHE